MNAQDTAAIVTTARDIAFIWGFQSYCSLTRVHSLIINPKCLTPAYLMYSDPKNCGLLFRFLVWVEQKAAFSMKPKSLKLIRAILPAFAYVHDLCPICPNKHTRHSHSHVDSSADSHTELDRVTINDSEHI